MTDPRWQDLARDLQTYLEQQAEKGPDWLLEAEAHGPDAPLADLEIAAAESGPAVAPAEVPGKPAAPTAPAAPPPAKQQREALFQQECATFVKESLALVARWHEQPKAPDQTDIFSAGQAGDAVTPAELSRDEKAAALGELAAEVAPCRRCKLHTGRTQTVFGTGDPDADLVLIGEAPGRDEDAQGLPFVGRSGQLLTKILEAIDLARDEVYIANILKCRPPQNRDPEPDEAATCEPYLQRQLEILEPKLILCLGRIAAQRLLGTSANLGALRRTVHFYRGIPVLATFHPAALLRNASLKRDAWDDVRKVRALYDALRAEA